jgi:hypothetical protein
MEIDWEAPRVKRVFVFSSLIPGLLGFAAFLGCPWELAALFAIPSGVVGGLVFGRRWKGRLLYVIPSIVTALATVAVMWLVIRWQSSVYFVVLMLCQLVAIAGTLPLWAAFHQRLEAYEDPQAARRAAFLAATRRDD